MKNVIIKFLGLDKIQQENAYLINKVDNLSNDLYHRDWSSSINYRELEREIDYGKFNIDAEDIADEFSTDDIAREIDHCAVAGELDLYDVSSNIDMGELARYIDKDDIASAIDLDDTISEVLDRHFDGEKMNEFASIVAEKIADRDGMHQLVSEEVDNQVNSISADAIQSMIDTAIQQFADSLEVMVSAKLNINK
jgi:replicative DNA helicase